MQQRVTKSNIVVASTFEFKIFCYSTHYLRLRVGMSEPTDTTENKQSPVAEAMIIDDKSSMDVKENTEQLDDAQKALEELEAIPSIMEKLSEDNTRYDLHVQLIGLLKKAGFDDQLEEARLAMHDIYPLSEDLWLDWINDTKKHANTVEGQAKLQDLYNKAEQDYFSIRIWKDYVEYGLHKFHENFAGEMTNKDESMMDLIEETREYLLRAVRATSSHVQQGQEIWKPYSDFELEVLKNFENADQIELVNKMYLDRLAVLHIQYADTFSAYSTFISNYANTNYEKTMVEANKVFAKTKKAAEERDVYEMKLTSEQYSLDSFYQYIEFEKGAKNMFSLNHVRSLYERAILLHCTNPELWNNYILFLIEQARIPSFLESTCLRAIRNCPWSGILWTHLARILESNDKPNEHIEEVFDRAMGSKLLLSSLEDLVTVLLAKCDYKRRKVDWEDLDEDVVMDLRVTFEECLEYLNELFPDTGDPFYRVEKYYAYISKRLGDIDKARELWQDIVDRHGLDTEAWLQFINFEREHGNNSRCETLFKQAIQKRLDNPNRLMDAWSTFEREVGTLESYEQCLLKINHKTQLLTRQWQSQYAREQNKKARIMEEKKIHEKRKKGQHRAAQKQKAKERKKLEQHEFRKPSQNSMMKNASETLKTAGQEGTSNDEMDENVEEKESSEQLEFKKPELPFSRAGGSTPMNTSSTLKRKLSVDESTENAESKKHKSRDNAAVGSSNTIKEHIPEGYPISRRGRGRGRSVKLPGGRMNKIPAGTTATVTSSSTTNETNVTADSSTAAPKTNDDFRAFLLGSKKK
ncbi:hypothetical protein BDF20DRAFT_916429 [Mycotypha africana]|uniref:uncharacterized protein n=1 Tax=Mycotypha africana TaxID=64632 RepID=UPI002301BD5A|nr:uncharacterized protein BDF20DRAFT_916429 [Mycotypha africana]KAI8969015.1 hypothetical protein BDF20DRAFT_916429 [Mycotypha africana]